MLLWRRWKSVTFTFHVGMILVGHHGLEPDDFPMIEVPTVECVAGRGLHGDRYFRFQRRLQGTDHVFLARSFR